MNLAEILSDHPADVPAVISGDIELTYGELQDQVARVAGGLAALGLDVGDRVALICANDWQFVVAYFGTLHAGMVAVPLNPASPAPELTSELAAVEAACVVVGQPASTAVGEIAPDAVPSLSHRVCCGGVELADSVTLESLMAAEPAPLVDRVDDDVAVLMFTSGTGGIAKAAMLSHRNLRVNIEQLQSNESRARKPGDVTFGVLPVSHIFGLNVVVGGTLFAGACVVMVDRFDPVTALELVRRHGVTDMTGPPAMWRTLAQIDGDHADALGSVRRAASGASKLPDEVARAVEDRFGVELREGYGLTETSPVVATAMGTDAPMGSIGRPLAGIELRIIDDDGDDVYVGDPGELLVRGPNVFAGYWNDPAATRLALTPDGWLRTGDVAAVDDDGYLYLIDRAKDLIIVNGFNVAPGEVEDVLTAHPDIEQAAAVGIDDPRTGEAVKAVVVLAPGADLSEQDVIDHAAAHLARYKAPTTVTLADSLPQGIGGKVLRRALR